MANESTEETGGRALVERGRPVRASDTDGAMDDAMEEAEHHARRGRERSRSRDS